MDRRRLQLLLAGTTIVVAFVWLFRSGMQASQVYYLTVSEYRAQADTIRPGDPFRISGRVQPGSVRLDDAGLDLAFTVYQPDNQSAVLPVAYHGVVPDTFMENSEVVVEGAMRDDTFVAHTLLAKCPSKYEAMADEEARREAARAPASTGT